MSGYVSLGPSDDMPYSTAAISVTAATQTLVTGVTAQIVRVYGIVLVPSAANNVTFLDSASSFSFGPLALAINQLYIMPKDGAPWFITAPGASFQITASAATVTGWAYYRQTRWGG